MLNTVQVKKELEISNAVVDNQNTMQVTPMEVMHAEMPSELSELSELKEHKEKDNKYIGYDNNEMNNFVEGSSQEFDEQKTINTNNNSPHTFDIVLQLKVLEEIKLMRTDIQTLRINIMLIKEEVRTNIQLTKCLLETSFSTDTKMRSFPTSRQRAEDSITGDGI